MNMVQKMIAFYTSLVSFIRNEVFVESSAEALVVLRKEVECSFTRRRDFSVNYLRIAYEEYQGDILVNAGCLDEIVKTAFRDLSGHMRSPEVRRVFKDFLDLVDPEERDLYVHITNVRRLDGRSDGCAVVTLVANDLGKLKGLLEKNVTANVVEWVHSV